MQDYDMWKDGSVDTDELENLQVTELTKTTKTTKTTDSIDGRPIGDENDRFTDNDRPQRRPIAISLHGEQRDDDDDRVQIRTV